MVRRRLLVPSLLLGLLGLGLQLRSASSAASAASAFGSKPVQILAPTDAARTALKPVEEGLRAIESLEVRRVCAGLGVGLAGVGRLAVHRAPAPCGGHDRSAHAHPSMHANDRLRQPTHHPRQIGPRGRGEHRGALPLWQVLHAQPARALPGRLHRRRRAQPRVRMQCIHASTYTWISPMVRWPLTSLPHEPPPPRNVFEVGRSVDPQTAGIWAFHRRVQIPAIHPEVRTARWVRFESRNHAKPSYARLIAWLAERLTDRHAPPPSPPPSR